MQFKASEVVLPQLGQPRQCVHSCRQCVHSCSAARVCTLGEMSIHAVCHVYCVLCGTRMHDVPHVHACCACCAACIRVLCGTCMHAVRHVHACYTCMLCSMCVCVSAVQHMCVCVFECGATRVCVLHGKYPNGPPAHTQPTPTLRYTLYILQIQKNGP